MPVKFILPFSSVDNESHIPHVPAGRHAIWIQAGIYRMLELSDPDMAHSLHDPSRPKPITVGKVCFRDGGGEAVISFLINEHLDALREGLSNNGNLLEFGVKNHYGTYMIDDMLPVLRIEPLIEILNPGVDFGRDKRFWEVNVSFETPTTFERKNGPGYYPFPDPVLVFKSWLGRWRCFVEDLSIEGELYFPELEEYFYLLRISRYEGKTKVMDYGTDESSGGSMKQIGFVGNITYTMDNLCGVPPEVPQLLQVLCNFAPYCGTGKNTMRGMGATDIYEVYQHNRLEAKNISN